MSLEEPRPRLAKLGQPALRTRRSYRPTTQARRTSATIATLSIRSSASPSLFIVEDVQLQGTLSCQHNHRTQLIHSTTIHPDAPGCHQGGHRLYFNSSPSVVAATRSKAPVTRLHVHRPSH